MRGVIDGGLMLLAAAAVIVGMGYPLALAAWHQIIAPAVLALPWVLH